MNELTFKSRRSSRLGIVLLTVSVLGLSASGCLLASGRPIRDFGVSCKGDNDCASFGFCAGLSGYNAVCLPKTAECTTENDPVCAGYACELTYGPTYAYCERNCSSSSDCATGHICSEEYNGNGDGLCK